jgi:hypothetical protein
MMWRILSDFFIKYFKKNISLKTYNINLYKINVKSNITQKKKKKKSESTSDIASIF